MEKYYSFNRSMILYSMIPQRQHIFTFMATTKRNRLLSVILLQHYNIKSVIACYITNHHYLYDLISVKLQHNQCQLKFKEVFWLIQKRTSK